LIKNIYVTRKGDSSWKIKGVIFNAQLGPSLLFQKGDSTGTTVSFSLLSLLFFVAPALQHCDFFEIMRLWICKNKVILKLWILWYWHLWDLELWILCQLWVMRLSVVNFEKLWNCEFVRIKWFLAMWILKQLWDLNFWI